MLANYLKKYWWMTLFGVVLLGGVGIKLISSIINAVSQAGEEKVLVSYISTPHLSGDMYFVTLDGIESEYEQLQGESLQSRQELSNQLELAINLAELGDYDASTEVFEEIVKRLNLPSVYNNLGVLYTIAEDYEPARNAYQTVFELDSNYEGTYLNAGLLLDTQGRLEDAISYLERSSLPSAQDKLNVLEAELQQPTHTREIEANDAMNQATAIQLETEIEGKLLSTDDQDFYVFETPTTSRDIVQIRLENHSARMEPVLRLFDADRNYLSSHQVESVGATLDYSFSAESGSTYYIHVAASFGSTVGNYSLSVTPLLAYDQNEPNEDILNPTVISLGNPLEAGKMDARDQDFYRFQTPDTVETVRIVLENRSTTFLPNLYIFDARKNRIHDERASNLAADIEYSFAAEPNSTYFINVTSPNNATTGDYALLVMAEETEAAEE